MSLTEIDQLPAWELRYWMIAAKRNRGEEILGLAQAIGLALGGKADDRVLSELIPEYNEEDGFDEDPTEEDLKQQAANFFGVPIDG